MQVIITFQVNEENYKEYENSLQNFEQDLLEIGIEGVEVTEK